MSNQSPTELNKLSNDDNSMVKDVPAAYMEKAATSLPAGSMKHTPEQIMEMLKTLGINQSQFKQTQQEKEKEYKFWKTQPVPQFNGDSTSMKEGIIKPNTSMDQIRQIPHTLPSTFEWCCLDITDENECKEVYDLLTQNYVEDDDALFRFDYSDEFLKWGIMPPGNKIDWQLGVRATESRKLVAFISGIPMKMSLKGKEFNMAEINFLCIHKQLRTKRLAPVLIKEITRRIQLGGIYQAVFTAGTLLPKPISTCRYFHRNLNPKKLIETGFSALHKNMSMESTIQNYKLPSETQTLGLRHMTATDVPQVTILLAEYLKKFSLAPVFNEEEIMHWLMPRKSILYAYVQDVDGKIEQFVSFYSLPSTVISHSTHRHINAAFLFYHAPKDNGKDFEAQRLLINDALILAKNADFDVFNCLEMMDNHNFVENLKFGRGDGNLKYYLYNYNLLNIENTDTALVML